MIRKNSVKVLIFMMILLLSITEVKSDPISVHTSNPRYFVDDSGKTLYLTGSHTWYNIHNNPDAHVTGNSYSSFEEYLDFMESHGHNFVRLWTGWAYLGVNPYPWERTGPGTANDGLSKFDMTNFNQGYFDVVRQRTLQVQNRGMYCSVMFFGSHNRFKNDFENIAWHEDNNINPELANAFDSGDGYSFFTTDPDALEIQRMLVRKFIDELNDIDNLIWEIMNEPGGTDESVDWTNGMINYVKSYESTKPKQHLVGMTGGWNLGTEMEKSGADWISPDVTSGNDYWSGNWESGNSPGGPADYDDKIVILDTDHLWAYSEENEVEDMRKWVWKTFARGNHPIFMDSYDSYVEGINYGEINPEFDPVRDTMGYTLDYANRFDDLSKMVPYESLSSTGYALADIGSEYLIYQPSSGQFSVYLESGNYNYEWFDPNSGNIISTGSLDSNDDNHYFSPPFSGDAVLYLFRESVTTTTIVECPPPGEVMCGGAFCTHDCQCSIDQGDCDDDVDCYGDLVCCDNIGENYGCHPSVDICRHSCETTSTSTSIQTTTSTSTSTITSTVITTSTQITTSITDSQSPKWFNLRHNPVSALVNGMVNILVDWWDDQDIQKIIISENSTGIWVEHTVYGG